MILSRLDLKAFGRFTDESIDLSAGPRRFHLIYGPNESGKSTTLRAITALFYGMPHAAEDCFVHRSERVRVGGLLVDPVSGGSLECVRRRGRKATLRDAQDDQPIAESRLESMLGGINRETFLARFGLSYEALVQGGSSILAGTGDLGQILFAAGAGVGRLREIQAELDNGASQLFLARGSKATINAALRQLDLDRNELREAQVPAAEFERLREELASKQREAAALDGELRQCVVSLARLKSFQEAIPLLPLWRTAKESLASVADAPKLDDDFVERRRQITIDRETAISRQKELETRIEELTRKLESIGCDPTVMTHEAEIESVFQQISARERDSQERIELIRSRDQLDRDMNESLNSLSREFKERSLTEMAETDGDDATRWQISESLRTRIRELAASYAVLISRRNDASELAESTKRRLADVTQELEQMETIGDPAVLAGVIESTGNPETETDALMESRQHCATLRQRCESMLGRLQGFNGDLRQATRLVLPSDSLIRQLTDELRANLHDVNNCDARLKELQSERDTTQHRFLECQAEFHLPSLVELREVRRRRDDVVDQIVEANREQQGCQEEIDELRKQIHLADDMSDTMRRHADQLHRRETLESQLAVLEIKIAEATEAKKAAQVAFETARSQWASAWQSCRIEAGQPEEMQQWLADHGKLCECMDQLEAEEQRLERIQTRINQSARRLRNALESVHSGRPIRTPSTFQTSMFDVPTDVDLLAIYDEAVAIRSQRMRDWQQAETLRRKRDELADELPRVECRFEATQKAVDQWYEDWRRLTESFANSDRVDTDEVLQTIDQIGQLNQLKRQRDTIVSKLRAMDQDESDYGSRVRGLADVIEQPYSDQQSPIAIAQAMYERLQAERSAARGRETLQEQLESSRQRLSSVTSQRNECELILQQFCAEAGCDSPDQLPEIERQSKERSELETSARDLESRLRRLAGEQSLDEFVAEAFNHQSPVLVVDIERAELMQAELKERIEQVHQEIGATQNELRRIDGGSRASELAQSIQSSAGLIRTDIESYARLKIGAFILKRAIDHYRQANQNPVLALANHYFQQLTCGEYVELKPDYDASGTLTLFGANASGEKVPVSGMSTGTADALYLALRLASLDHQMKEDKAIPVVIDDCLIQLDDARATAALKAFSELSEKTQVILFTHHQHLCELARQHLAPGDYHFHQIGT